MLGRRRRSRRPTAAAAERRRAAAVPQRAADRLRPAPRTARRWPRRIDEVAAELGRIYPLVIDGRGGRRRPRRRSTRSIPSRHARGSSAGSATADADARRGGRRRRPGGASPAGRRTPAAERAAVLLRAAAIMRRAPVRAGRLGGLRVRQALARGRRRRRRGDRLLRVLRPRDDPPGRAPRAATCPARPTPSSTSPRGVAVVIPPWNFPLAIPAA